MSECMPAPDNWKDFIKEYSFIDIREVYTNNSRLIPTFRVEQMMELYYHDWVSVKDRLPETGVDVLVTDGLHTMVTWCENTDDGVKWVDNYYTYVNVRFKEVTHWMPLPELPKGENDG